MLDALLPFRWVARFVEAAERRNLRHEIVHDAGGAKWAIVAVMGDRADIIALGEVADALEIKRDETSLYK